MSRPREFEADDALEHALDVFWTKGYQGASMADLLSATGLSKSSLYGAFGCKHDVFVAAFRRYSEHYLDEARQLFTAEGEPLEQIRRYLGRVLCADDRRGCMMVNMAVELAPTDKPIEREGRRHWEKLAAMLSEVLRRGQQQGRIAAGIDAAGWGPLLVSLASGLYVMKKGGTEDAILQAVIETTLSQIAGSVAAFHGGDAKD